MSVYILAFLIGVVVGLRSLSPPAVVSWAARAGWLHLENTWLAFMGFSLAPYIWSALAIAELVADKLPNTPSRKAPPGAIARVVDGALCGACLGATAGAWVGGLVVGAVGGVVGMLGGYEFRRRLAKALGHDLPAALLEDAIAIGGAILIVSRL